MFLDSVYFVKESSITLKNKKSCFGSFLSFLNNKKNNTGHYYIFLYFSSNLLSCSSPLPANQVQSMLALLSACQGRHLCRTDPPKPRNESKQIVSQEIISGLASTILTIGVCSLSEWLISWLSEERKRIIQLILQMNHLQEFDTAATVHSQCNCTVLQSGTVFFFY